MANKSKDGPEQDNESGHERELAAGKKVEMATQYSDRIRTEKVEPEGPQLSPNLQGHLGRQLRAVYSELIQEPMPDKFSKLLEELAASQKVKSKQREQE
jgi:Anti-sigma factor NepR